MDAIDLFHLCSFSDSVFSMITLDIGNSFSKINNLDRQTFEHLRKELSYQTDAQAAYFSGGFRRTKYCIDAKGNFPTGLLGRVKAFLSSQKLVYSTSTKPAPEGFVDHQLDLGLIAPYKAQEEACASGVAMGRGTIAMPTGTGKSLVIALLISKMRLRTLVLVPNLEIKKQLTESLQRLFSQMQYIRVENVDSKALKSLTDFDCLIIDEAHHVAAKTYQNLNKSAWKGIYYRFFFTATPFRNNSEENLLFEGIAGQIIYSLEYGAAVRKGYIVPIESYYIEINKTKTTAFTWQQVYKELVIQKSERNSSIVQLADYLKHRSTLILVKEIEHGNILRELSGIPFANGQDDSSRELIQKFNSGEIAQLIGTTGIIGEGVDTKPCEFVIIAGLGKAKSAFMQQVGRAVRKYPGKESAKVILIKDRSHKFLTRHFKAQCAILIEEYSIIEPTKLELK